MTDPRAMMHSMKSVILCFLLVGCMKQTTDSLKTSTEIATDGIGCENLQSKMFDSIYSYLDQEKKTPNLEDLNFFVSAKIDQIAIDQKIKDLRTLEKYKIEFSRVFEIMINEPRSLKEILDTKKLLQTLIEMEMQDQSTLSNMQLNARLNQQMTRVKELGQELDLSCQESTTPPISQFEEAQKSMVVGMNNVFTTAYQSCQAYNIPAITGSTPKVVGITKLAQNHPDGIGGRRVIGQLSSVQQTHPYIKVAGQLSSSTCFDVNSNPLIYDYGGEPFVSNNSLNFFKNAGSGTSVLGIDCSSLISAAAGAGGLRYKPGLENKAIFIRQSSEKFINAAASGFTCYQNITVTPSNSIKAGDIAAVHGHVLMIGRVGEDPFGFKKFASASACNSVNSRNFDFTLVHSSATKNGMGINKYVAKDYLNEVNPDTIGSVEKMRTLFTSMGQAACKAYFTGKVLTPKSSEWGIIRHKGTAACLAPKIKMAGQSCVSSCQL